MLDELKSRCIAFIHLIQSSPERKSSDFSMELQDLRYGVNDLSAEYLDTKSNKRYEVTISEIRTKDPLPYLESKL